MVDQTDYGAYMASIYPGTTWHFELLSGGLVNTTLRASRLSGDAPHDSLVLKHARPYVQAAGPGFPFTIKRQEVEAEVLKLWHEHGALYDTRSQTGGWRTPRFIRLDQGTELGLNLSDKALEASMLVLSDLGRVVNIVEFLQLLVGASPAAADLETAPGELGRAVGVAFAGVHSPETVEKIRELPDTTQTLSLELSSDLVRLAALEPLRQRLSPFPYAERYFQRVNDDYGTAKYGYRQCFVLGDFTPGSVMLPPPGEGHRIPAIIDWEFARLQGRGVNGDMAQFLASIHCELIAAETDDPSGALVAALSQFASALCSGYREQAMLRYRRQGADANVQLMRSAFLLHGREMINQAHETFDAHRRQEEMVRVGVWYIDAAGGDADEFVEPANWEKMQGEDRMLVQSLFAAE